MRLSLQGIEHQNFGSFQEWVGFFWDGVGIGDVTKVSNSKTQNRKFVMENWKRCNPNTIDLKGELVNFYASHLWDARIFFIIKDIGVFSLKLLDYGCSTKNGNVSFLVKIKWTNVIQASCMVLVLMGKQYCIQLFDAFPEHLHSEIRPCINDKGLPLDSQMNGSSKSFVSKV